MSNQLESLWDDQKSAPMSEPELLKYRSNLLGSDLRITNYGGGNTSVKTNEKDPLNGEDVEVLWVKGSGGDLGSIGMDGFSTLYMDKLKKLPSLYRGLDHEDEMVAYLPHCTFNLNSRAASIDTPLHTYIPHKHVDHMHPDAVIAIACTANSEELTKDVFAGKIGWLPWQRPGFDLGLNLEKIATTNPEFDGVILAGHGLFTWADSSKECYLKTLEIINHAQSWLDDKNTLAAFGGVRYDQPLPETQRHKVISKLMPIIRGKITGNQMKIGHFNDSKEIIEFVNSKNLHALAALGTSCPDHFLRTKIRPLVVDFNPEISDILSEIDRVIETLDDQLEAYRNDYAGYYNRNKHNDSPAMRDPNAVVYLLPGVGMITFAKDKATARIAGEFYVNAINVMRQANGVDTYVGLDEQEAFNIEYWLLEEAKLQRMPKPKKLAGQIAFVTGGAGGIGSATAKRLLADGACVMLADIDEDALIEKSTELATEFSSDVVRTTLCNVTDEQSIIAAISETSKEFGGIDILVSNAGIASAAPLDETSLELWSKNIDILTTGYFLVTREGFKVMKAQNIGGSIVFVASKNGLVASANASAYCTAKGAEIHLSRAVALEGAPLGIRCNVVNPDAVLKGSKIWTGNWRKERADAYDMAEDELEEHYRKRSLLKRNVYPEDIAEAIYFLASDSSDKSTGNVINVDAGHAPSFTR